MSAEHEIIDSAQRLREIADELRALPAGARRVALDTESNGMFVFRPALCVVQLAWEGAGGPRVAVVDSLAVPVAPLAGVLGDASLVKVLHDLHFDARLLLGAGITLAGVRDTSTSARFLGARATGLAAVLEAELGVRIEKSLQRHDWSERPLTPHQLAYLGSDVAHLLALDEALARREREAGIEEEVATETAYRLAGALTEPPPSPSYLRLKGALSLGAPARAVLRRLAAWREGEAERIDRPPHQVVPNDVLVTLATERPRTEGAVRRLGRLAARHTHAILRAVQAGEADGDVPPGERAEFQRPAQTRSPRLRACERALSAFRAEEAARRGVSDSVVLPGHAAARVASLGEIIRDEAELHRALGALEGLGRARVERYGAALARLLASLPE